MHINVSIVISDGPRDPSLVLILKWGGELTPAGKIQAEELGKAFRCMYPGGAGKCQGHWVKAKSQMQKCFFSLICCNLNYDCMVFV